MTSLFNKPLPSKRQIFSLEAPTAIGPAYRQPSSQRFKLIKRSDPVFKIKKRKKKRNTKQTRKRPNPKPRKLKVKFNFKRKKKTVPKQKRKKRKTSYYRVCFNPKDEPEKLVCFMRQK